MTKKFMEAAVGIFFLTFSAVIIIVGLTTKSAIQEFVVIQQEQAKLQAEIMTSANETKELASEAAYAFCARTFESEGMMSPTDANKIVSEAIDKITARSEKLGLFAKSLNDSYLKEQY